MTGDPKLVYAREARCPCGAGLAYRKAGDQGDPYLGYWDCSEILLRTADEKVQHTDKLPFAFWKIRAETPEETTR